MTFKSNASKHEYSNFKEENTSTIFNQFNFSWFGNINFNVNYNKFLCDISSLISKNITIKKEQIQK